MKVFSVRIDEFSTISSIILILTILFYIYRRKSTEKHRPSRRGVDRSKTYPRQFPCGWYRICNSDELSRAGQVKHIVALGREMVAFRSDDAEHRVYVMDAFCVHMGANLAFGGRVMPGSHCIQCPFHLWEFNGQTGVCSKVPYADGKIPEKVRQKNFEQNFSIFLQFLGQNANVPLC